MGLDVVTYMDQLQNLQTSACHLSDPTGLLRQGPASAFPSVSFSVGGPLHPEHAHGRTRDAGCIRATTRSGAERRVAPPLLQSGRNVEKVSPTLAPQQTYTVVERACL
ncbi:hypothetical protein ALC53_10016 [Atta colombica]|uniref:Uncharacterized protein n=1 Tax=Atta colombica TaxID=520822 RepID=A0A195B5N8_9HYME|nr:hypothetical protein ALC53_10016 [Atta colombica]